LSYITPAGTDSNAVGLGTTTADGNGVCTWKWNIGPKTKPGTGHLFVTVGDSHATFDIEIQ
jgi:hypothetical protein